MAGGRWAGCRFKPLIISRRPPLPFGQAELDGGRGGPSKPLRPSASLAGRYTGVSLTVDLSGPVLRPVRPKYVPRDRVVKRTRPTFPRLPRWLFRVRTVNVTLTHPGRRPSGGRKKFRLIVGRLFRD